MGYKPGDNKKSKSVKGRASQGFWEEFFDWNT